MPTRARRFASRSAFHGMSASKEYCAGTPRRHASTIFGAGDRAAPFIFTQPARLARVAWEQVDFVQR
mgnify:CR=1 FL=1